MAEAMPMFGYACCEAEHIRWNQIRVQQGINNILSWVGEKPDKYVPGLYWWTLIAQALAARHDVSLVALADVAREHVVLAGGQNLFRFYDRPEDWASATTVVAARASQPGIFDVEKARPLVEATKTVIELCEVTARWP